MAVVTGARVASSFLLFMQLMEYIGCGIVDGNQTRMGSVHQMGAGRFFFSEEHAQSARRLLCSCPRESEWDFDTLPELSQNGFQEGNDNSAVNLNLMHGNDGIAHVYQVDTKMRYQPVRVEERICIGLLSL
jgi:hypothetical protein